METGQREGFNEEKFKNLILYICWKSEPDKLGSVKLNKVLWFADAYADHLFKQPITGEIYIKKQRGPVPKDGQRCINALVEEERLVVREVDYHGFVKHEYFPLQPPNMGKFKVREVDLVREVIDWVCNRNTATSISNETHQMDGWEDAAIGEEIPYEYVRPPSPETPTQADMDWAVKTLQAAGN